MNRPGDAHVYRALTIAGSDSGGGAGIQADLKTLHQFGVYGMSVVTAVTAQNTRGVQHVHEIPACVVREQLESLGDDIGFDAVKTGMVTNSEIIHTVAEFLGSYRQTRLVVDPVLVAKGGTSLLATSALSDLICELLPLCEIVTPNLVEAQTICQMQIRSWKDCRHAARIMADMGPRVVVIKGGHHFLGTSPSPWAIDLVLADGMFTYLASERIASTRTHGTGCTFAAAAAAGLAKGMPVLSTIMAAKTYVHRAIESAQNWDVGSGQGPLDHTVPSEEFPDSSGDEILVWDGYTWSAVENQKWAQSIHH